MVASMAEQPHVLVVDDDAKIAAALRRALIYEGYQVEVAPDGQIALTRARERMPDLAILDIMMPGIDGLEVTRRLRAEGKGVRPTSAFHAQSRAGAAPRATAGRRLGVRLRGEQQRGGRLCRIRS